MSNPKERIAALTPEKRALLMRQLRDKGARTAQAPIPIRPRDAASHPLSYAQQRLWVLDQLEPGSAAYNISLALRLKGALDVEALRRAFEEVVRRHEVLRTTFVSDGGEP